MACTAAPALPVIGMSSFTPCRSKWPRATPAITTQWNGFQLTTP